MVPSDWLTIILSIVGILAGAGISWMFFRTQMLTDVRALREKLIELNVPRDVNAALNPKMEAIHSDIKDLQTKLNMRDEFKNSKEISSIKTTLEKLDCNLNSAIKNILHDVKAQQFELAEKIQKEYKTQSDTASNIIRDAFSNEINKFIGSSVDREKLLHTLVESFKDGIRVMGEYQRKNIENETSNSITDIEHKISNSIGQVLEEVVELRHQVRALPSLAKEDMLDSKDSEKPKSSLEKLAKRGLLNIPNIPRT